MHAWADSLAVIVSVVGAERRPSPRNMRELRTHTPEQPLLPNNTLTADGGARSDEEPNVTLCTLPLPSDGTRRRRGPSLV
ncbi:hypothetical protein DdX_02969 [Ditylenchus destructor]|uniref:Uncharacterized protein n=1 Tax=Ditylenchus destructor TaxID=166010 RepID=A0AAD4NDS2_9BILA|nr:hypothetical protein DdX_02969 [Ditylenchus destructor]